MILSYSINHTSASLPATSSEQMYNHYGFWTTVTSFHDLSAT